MQSEIGTTFKDAKKKLENGETVLFCGTPCQIGGLLSYLGKKYENLITVDFVCHGIPSPLLWEKYIEHQEKKHGSKVSTTTPPSFRNKAKGWSDYEMNLCFENGKKYSMPHSLDLFFGGFLSDISLRPSCYNCHFKSLKRQSDITLADFWGIKNVAPDMFDNGGVSLVFVNSEKGRKYFSEIKEKMTVKAVDIDNAVRYNPSASTSVKRPEKRDAFLQEIKDGDFKKAVFSATNVNLLQQIKTRIKITAKRILK